MTSVAWPRTVLTAALAGMLLLAGASVAEAQGRSERQRARQLYDEAQALFDSGDYAAAESSFRAAHDIVPNPVVLLAIAAAQERQEHFADAAETFREYLDAAPDARDRAEVEGRLADILARPSTLTLTTNPPGATIFVDGEDSGEVTPADVEVPTGTHQVRIELPGFQSVEQEIVARPGTRMRLALSLRATADPLGERSPGADLAENGGSETASGGSSGPSATVWVLTTVAGITLASGLVFGFLALSEQSNFDNEPMAQTADRGEAFALVADVSFGVSLAAAVAALVLYVVESSGGDEAPSAQRDGPRLGVLPWATPNGGGLATELRF